MREAADHTFASLDYGEIALMLNQHHEQNICTYINAPCTVIEVKRIVAEMIVMQRLEMNVSQRVQLAR